MEESQKCKKEKQTKSIKQRKIIKEKLNQMKDMKTKQN